LLQFLTGYQTLYLTIIINSILSNISLQIFTKIDSFNITYWKSS